MPLNRLKRFFESIFSGKHHGLMVWNWLLLSICFLHLGIKFFTLSVLELQGDEAFSVFYAQQSIPELLSELNKEANPPLYYLLLHFWIKLFGIGLLAVKSLNILISIGTAIFLFKITKLFGNIWFTIFVSGCFLLSNTHYDFSHEIRAFQLVLFLCAGSYYVFIKFIETNKAFWLIGLILFSAALPYTHYNAVLIPIVQFVVCLTYWNKNKKTVLKFLLAFSISALLFLPQLLTFLNVIPDDTFWLSLSTWEDLKFIAFKVVGNDPGYYLLMIPYFLAPLIVLIGIGFKWFRKEFSWRMFLLFWSLFLFPLLLNFWIAQYVPSLQFKYILYTSFGVYLSLGYLFISLQKVKWLAPVYFILVLLQLIVHFSPSKRDGEGWNETAQMVKSYQKQKVAVIISYNLKVRDLYYYYDRDAFGEYKNIEKAFKKSNIFPVWNANDLDSIGNLMQYDKVILLLSHSDVHDPEGKIQKNLDQKLSLCYEIGDRIRTKIRVYNTGNSACTSFRKLSKEEIPSNACWFWEKKVLLEQISGVKVDSYDLNFSKCDDKIFVDETTAFSPNFKDLVKNISIVDCNILFTSKERPSSMLVVSTEQNGKTLKRAEYNLADYFSDGKGEISIKSSVLGDYPGDAEVNVYVWNPGGPTIELQKMEILFWKK